MSLTRHRPVHHARPQAGPRRWPQTLAALGFDTFAHDIPTLTGIDDRRESRGVQPEGVLTPREAFFAPRQVVPLAEAAGRVTTEMIAPYPPGIPLLLPGDRVT